VAGSVVKYEKALGPALGEAFKNVDRVIDLAKKIVSAEVSIAIFASLEYDSGFPDGIRQMDVKMSWVNV
jgi:hypothetical protein